VAEAGAATAVEAVVAVRTSRPLTLND